jgi:hypothetical protein
MEAGAAGGAVKRANANTIIIQRKGNGSGTACPPPPRRPDVITCLTNVTRLAWGKVELFGGITVTAFAVELIVTLNVENWDLKIFNFAYTSIYESATSDQLVVAAESSREYEQEVFFLETSCGDYGYSYSNISRQDFLSLDRACSANDDAVLLNWSDRQLTRSLRAAADLDDRWAIEGIRFLALEKRQGEGTGPGCCTGLSPSCEAELRAVSEAAVSPARCQGNPGSRLVRGRVTRPARE